ncbi:hypothetical protein VTJ04DRAFT_2111 [Mycothermus thermophilus]|uniref:uncharacterized protein n=1 Tax=Humicola insolens TaxID=85995 RepID=UPI003743E4DD
MQKLVSAARGVRFRGIPRRHCESCSRTYATQVISRRTSERRSDRPFERISWDLFHFNPGFDGSQWLLVIRDEYSGRLTAIPLTTKSGPTVTREIKNFVAWVRTQFGLKVKWIRQDNDTGTISQKGFTSYQVWAAEEGIVIELTPTHTHEPNGGSELAGRLIIDKALVIRISANLPEELWPECVRAAAWLFNMTPSQRNNWKSPNEKLLSWFRQYFRWSVNSVVIDRTRDLRPHLGGLYAYGCRAYPVDKQRELASGNRKLFKTKERAHIGYLAGYQASNIYRIWVPALKRVIVTRNVKFDERQFYRRGEEDLTAEQLRVTRHVAEYLEVSLKAQTRDAGAGLELEVDDPESLDRSPSPNSPTRQGEGTSDRQEGQESGVEEVARTELPPQKPSDDSAPAGLPTPERSVSPEIPPANLQAVSEDTERSRVAARDSPTTDPEDHGDTIVVRTSHEGDHSVAQDTIVVAQEALQPAGGDSNPPQEPSETDEPQGETSQPSDEMPRPKRKYTRKVWPTASRHSKRQRGQNPDSDSEPDADDEGPAPGIVGFATSMYRDEENIYLPEQEGWNTFCGFFVDEQEAIHQGDERHKTVHSVFAAAVRQRAALRPGAAPQAPPPEHISQVPTPPQSYRAIKGHRFEADWYRACDDEWRGMFNRKTWRKVKREEAKGRILPLKWVFTYKLDEEGNVERCKARLCVRGDLQPHSSLETTYAATLAARSFRLMMAIAAFFDLETEQFDVKQAFLYSDIDQPVYVKFPDGYEENGYCLRVEKGLYGLREAPYLWYREFSKTLRKLGLTASKEEPCLFFDRYRRVVVIFYVDDYLVLYHRRHAVEARRIINALKAKYEVHEKGEAKWFLGVRILRDRAKRQIFLVHDGYIEKVAKKFDTPAAGRAPYTPLPVVDLVKNEKEALEDEIKYFQELVGSILYTAIMIRPDVAFAAAKLSQFLTNPSYQHIKAALQVIHYLYGTRHLGICYGGEGNGKALLIAGDASFADDLETRRSSQGYVMMLFGGVIAWKAGRQTTVTTSSTEAELMALTSTARETIALQRLFRDIRLDLGEPWRIYCDNTNAIRLVVEEGTRISTTLRHVDIHNMWVREQHANGTFEVEYLPTREMPADGLTKALARSPFEHFRRLLNLQNTRQAVEKQEQAMQKA